MPDIETMQQYLVKIGWDVKASDFNKASSLLDKFKDKVVNISGKMGVSFIAATSTIISSIVSINEATFDFLESQAELDLSFENMARRMHTTEERVRSFTTAMEALEIDQSELMYMTEEQYQRLIELNTLGRSLEPPKAIEDTLRLVRDIDYQFSKLKFAFSYGSRWISYYLGQYIGKDLESIRNKLSNVTNWTIKNIDPISKKIAGFLNFFWRMGKALLEVFRLIFNAIKYLAELIGYGNVGLIGALVALFALIRSGPIGRFIMLLSTLLLLIDDYNTWKEGGDALFDWTQFDEAVEKAKLFFDTIKNGVKEFKEFLKDPFGLEGTETNLQQNLSLATGGGQYEGTSIWDRIKTFFSKEYQLEQVKRRYGEDSFVYLQSLDYYAKNRQSAGAFDGRTINNDMSITINAPNGDANTIADTLSDRIAQLFRNSNMWS